MICATNVDIDTALRDGRLREDLYFRINTIQVRVAPLRERTEDIPLLCTYFVDKFNERYRKNVKGISPAAYHLLIRNRWAGNVRELENAIERAVLVAKGIEVQPDDLPEPIRDESSTNPEFSVPPHHTLAEIEKMAILQTLQRTNWNKQEAAHILGLYRPTLYSKMRKHNIEDPGRAARAAREARRARTGLARSGGIVNERSIIIVGASSARWPAWRRAICFSPPQGRRWRVDAERNLTTFVQEAERLLSAADQVRQSVAELRGGQSGWARSA